MSLSQGVFTNGRGNPPSWPDSARDRRGSQPQTKSRQKFAKKFLVAAVFNFAATPECPRTTTCRLPRLRRGRGAVVRTGRKHRTRQTVITRHLAPTDGPPPHRMPAAQTVPACPVRRYCSSDTPTGAPWPRCCRCHVHSHPPHVHSHPPHVHSHPPHAHSHSQLIFFACHPTCVGPRMQQSADYCGATRTAIERATHAPALCSYPSRHHFLAHDLEAPLSRPHTRRLQRRLRRRQSHSPSRRVLGSPGDRWANREGTAITCTHMHTHAYS